MLRPKRTEETQIVEPKPKESSKPYLKPNRGESSKMEYYFYIEPSDDKELEKYYKKLRTLEEITEDKLGHTTMQVQIKGKENVKWKPSMLGSCFRDDNEDYEWYNKTKINNTHWMIKFKKYYDYDEDELIKCIRDTKLIYENDYILVIYYNFAINS